MKDDQLTIVGAGGHSKVVISTAIECGKEVSIILDDDESKWGKELFGIKIQGPIAAFRDKEGQAVMAIGDNMTRKRISDSFKRISWLTLIHPTAYVHYSALIGEGTVIFAGSIIQPDVRIGGHCIINTGATIDHDCRIDDFVHIGPGVNIAGGVIMGEGVFMGIGSKVIIGKTIGEWSVVGAGGVVVADIPSYSKATGIPAKVIKRG